jgi:hypothetical protein
MQTNKLLLAPAITIEISVRIALWLVLCLVEGIGASILDDVPPNYLFYVINLSLAVVLFLAVRRFGDSAVVCDILDLCLYDLLVQVLGLTLHFFHRYAPPYIALTNALVILKCLRLVWVVKKTGSETFVSWPIFGIFGYWQRRLRGGDDKPAGRHNRQDRQTRHDWHGFLVYCMMGLSLPFGYLLFKFETLYVFLALTPFVFVMLYAQPYVNSLVDMHAQYLAIAQELVKVQARAKARAKARQKENRLREREMAAPPVMDPAALMAQFQRLRPPHQQVVAQLIHDALLQYPGDPPEQRAPELRLVGRSEDDIERDGG